ncbi:hypothetical protein RDWZM_006526 [Blomia tropicalis]|uniref:Uncharacterized protein n=1 Tax=Blomia tropicalis TaxID=40697 RepID=A0A9Q0M8F0_BLOTA|nr:hypothetical protein RDWZM_006526 [Blomia tropicalis]
MKFLIVLLSVAALASANVRKPRNLNLILGSGDSLSSSTNALARSVGTILLAQARPSVRQYAYAPQYQFVHAAAPSVQYVQAPAQTVRLVQAPAQTVKYVEAPIQLVQTVQQQGPINAAVQTTRSLQVVDVASTGGAAAPQSIVIGPSVQPLDIEFQSQSSPISVRQTHIPGTPNAPQHSAHEDEPDYLRQEITKPIIHEVTEVIQPHRKITQEVRPVEETVNQILTRGQQQQQVAVQPVAVQAAAPVQIVQAAPAPVEIVQAAPAPVEIVQAAPAPVVEAVQEAAPVAATSAQTIQLGEVQPIILKGGRLNIQTAVLPANARISRF